MMNAWLLRRRIFLAIGLAGLGCENNPEPRTPTPGESPPPIETIAPPGGDNVVALPAEPSKCGGCVVNQICQVPLAEVPPAHYPAPYEHCPVQNNFSVQMTNSMRSSGSAGACCYANMYMHPMGRPLRHEDVAVVPTILSGANASADRFVEIARIEHSSVASFADLSLSLLAHGAPTMLIAEAHRAALDELGHAQAALDIATALDGVPRVAGPMAIPEGDRSFHALVRSTVIDGCFGEVIGSLDAAAEVHEDVRIDAFFRRVAEEEANHAELAFRIVAWALAHDRTAAEAAIADGIAAVSALRVRNDVTMQCLRALLDGAVSH